MKNDSWPCSSKGKFGGREETPEIFQFVSAILLSVTYLTMLSVRRLYNAGKRMIN
jgi:hypothetical protein